MAHKLIDRCKETTSTTGTGTLTLTGAVAGYVAMADATGGLTADGDTSWFCAESGSEWELFFGTRVDATHLARTTVLASSNSGSAVSFTAAPTVFSTVPAKVLNPGPAVRVRRATSDQTITTGVWTKIQLNSEEVDTAGCFDPTTNYRWTPNVAGYYQTSFAVEFSAAGALSAIITSAYKNGTADHYGSYSPGVSSVAGASAGSGLVYMNGTTDYLELWALAVGTTPKAINSQVTKFMAFLARPD